MTKNSLPLPKVPKVLEESKTGGMLSELISDIKANSNEIMEGFKFIKDIIAPFVQNRNNRKNPQVQAQQQAQIIDYNAPIDTLIKGQAQYVNRDAWNNNTAQNIPQQNQVQTQTEVPIQENNVPESDTMQTQIQQVETQSVDNGVQQKLLFIFQFVNSRPLEEIKKHLNSYYIPKKVFDGINLVLSTEDLEQLKNMEVNKQLVDIIQANMLYDELKTDYYYTKIKNFLERMKRQLNGKSQTLPTDPRGHKRGRKKGRRK